MHTGPGWLTCATEWHLKKSSAFALLQPVHLDQDCGGNPGWKASNHHATEQLCLLGNVLSLHAMQPKSDFWWMWAAACSPAARHTF